MSEQVTAAGNTHPERLEEINFTSQAVQNCPYPTYALMRERAPVWRDSSGHFHITSYKLLREVLRDNKNYVCSKSTEKAALDQEKVARINQIYAQKGWIPAPTILQLDEPQHGVMRAQFEQAFSPSKVKQMEPLFKEVAESLIDGFIGKGSCDWATEFALRLPLTVVLRQSGIPLQDMWRIHGWTDAWVRHHLSFMQTEEESRQSAELEVERQHYFQPIFERLRKQPDGSLISDLVNNVIPQWNRRLTDAELHTAIGIDLLVGGIETTTNAVTEAMHVLADNPNIWAKLKAEPAKYLQRFIEEVLRLEAPAQALYRTVAHDVELNGVNIPKGSTVILRFGAANRDGEKFKCPDQIDLERQNAGAHMTFGSGLHHCLGATLSRAEIFWSLTTALQRFKSVRCVPAKNDFNYVPSRSLRALKHLYIEFDRV